MGLKFIEPKELRERIVDLMLTTDSKFQYLFEDESVDFLFDVPCNQTFLGYYNKGELSGYISYIITEDHCIVGFCICSFFKPDINFIKSLVFLLKKLFCFYEYNSLTFGCYKDSPHYKTYKKILDRVDYEEVECNDSDCESFSEFTIYKTEIVRILNKYSL